MLAAARETFYAPPVPPPVDAAAAQASPPPPNAAAPPRPVCDLAIFTAAVADYRPTERHSHKQKKSERKGAWTVELVANPDILATLAADKGSTLIVGFAAETRDVIAAARRKRAEKNADLIVANDVSNPALGFAASHNRWHLVTEQGVESTDILHKRALARLLLDALVPRL
jgi:phosphopantothenoylcysteine decarboxylase/phosphopantothenate--cysteine ligase